MKKSWREAILGEAAAATHVEDAIRAGAALLNDAEGTKDAEGGTAGAATAAPTVVKLIGRAFTVAPYRIPTARLASRLSATTAALSSLHLRDVLTLSSGPTHWPLKIKVTISL